jgi:hypothetical protein
MRNPTPDKEGSGVKVNCGIIHPTVKASAGDEKYINNLPFSREH